LRDQYCEAIICFYLCASVAKNPLRRCAIVRSTLRSNHLCLSVFVCGQISFEPSSNKKLFKHC
jgi:hypothetical protein